MGDEYKNVSADVAFKWTRKPGHVALRPGSEVNSASLIWSATDDVESFGASNTYDLYTVTAAGEPKPAVDPRKATGAEARAWANASEGRYAVSADGFVVGIPASCDGVHAPYTLIGPVDALPAQAVGGRWEDQDSPINDLATLQAEFKERLGPLAASQPGPDDGADKLPPEVRAAVEGARAVATSPSTGRLLSAFDEWAPKPAPKLSADEVLDKVQAVVDQYKGTRSEGATFVRNDIIDALALRAKP